MQIKVGIGLMALGVGVWVAWGTWTRTREIVPVDVPVTMAGGRSVEERFELNYDGRYLIEIAAEDARERQPGVTRAEWSLSSAGQEVQKGSTEEAHSAPGGSAGAARVIGEFNGRAGQDYELQVKLTGDASKTGPARARLRVAVSGLARENLQAASVLVFSMAFICGLFGMVLVGIGLWRRASV